MWILLIITAAGAQASGTYDDYSQCQRTVKELREQAVRAVCTQQERPEQAMQRIVAQMQQIIKVVDNR